MVKPKQIAIYGSINLDTVWILPEIPGPHTKIRALDFSVSVGGSASHTAISVANEGHHASIISDLPNDSKGLWCLEQLQKNNIDTSGINIGSIPFTGEATVLLYGSDKRIITSPKNNVPELILTSNQTRLIKTADWIHLTSSDSSRAEEILNTVLKRRLAGEKVALSVETKGIINKKIIDHSDFAFINAQEFKNLFGFPVEKSPYENVLPLIGNRCTLIVTNEGRPIYSLKNIDLNNCKSISHPIENIDHKIVNRNGAGDTFNGGFISSYVLNNNLQESIIRGQNAAVNKLIQS